MFGQGHEKGVKWRAAFAAEAGELAVDAVELPLPPETRAKLRKVNAHPSDDQIADLFKGFTGNSPLGGDQTRDFLVITIREMCREGSARTAPGNDSDNGVTYAAGSSRFEQLVHPEASRQPPCSAPVIPHRRRRFSPLRGLRGWLSHGVSAVRSGGGMSDVPDAATMFSRGVKPASSMMIRSGRGGVSMMRPTESPPSCGRGWRPGRRRRGSGFRIQRELSRRRRWREAVDLPVPDGPTAQ